MSKPKNAQSSGEISVSKVPRGLEPYVYKPGQTGNPSGRPKGTAEMTALARTFTEEAILKMAELMRNSHDERVSFAAAKELVDRGHGRPGEQEKTKPVMGLTREELKERMRASLSALEREDGE